MSKTDIQTPERFGGEPLYGNFPLDYRQRDRPFTVTIADAGRYHGERPSKYVVDACSTEKAWVKALAWHMGAEESIDCYVLDDESFEGLPDGAPGFQWNDLRPELKRQRDLDDLADQAAELLRQCKGDGTGRAREGAAWAMVRELAGLDGRTEEEPVTAVPVGRILHRVRFIWPDAGWVLREPPGVKPSLTWQGGPGVEEVAKELRWPDIGMTRVL